jgi:hypothetical protein
LIGVKLVLKLVGNRHECHVGIIAKNGGTRGNLPGEVSGCESTRVSGDASEGRL